MSELARIVFFLFLLLQAVNVQVKAKLHPLEIHYQTH